jgi:hypothetical protein
MPRTLGIDFGYSDTAKSLGFSHFETQASDGMFTISIRSPSETSTLSDFKGHGLQEAIADGITLVAIDAPITPERISFKPKSGRQIERRFARGAFNNSKRGPQPSSISVPKQGWPLYCGAMDLMADLSRNRFTMAPIAAANENAVVKISGKSCIEVCPKMTQALLAPKLRVVGRPNKNSTPSFYRQIDNWLFSHLFVAVSPRDPVPDGGSQPIWGVDRSEMCRLLGDSVQIDESVWDEAKRISIIQPLNERHELIGAFVAAFQGALVLAGGAVAVGTSGDHEGYYALPSQWHSDWVEVWNATTRDKESVQRFPIQISLQ